MKRKTVTKAGEDDVQGADCTPEHIDAMEDAEIEELHARYGARLGAAMSKSLGSSLLRMYASVVSMLLRPALFYMALSVVVGDMVSAETDSQT